MSSKTQQLRAIDNDLPPRHIPKLTYRNHVGESNVTTSNYQSISYHPSYENEQRISSSVLFEQAISSLDTAEPSPSSKASVSTTIRETQAIVPRRSSASVSMNRSSEASANVDDMKRRKHNSFLGFLSLKEPSTSALEDFARQQQKQAAAKGGKATAIGMPGISTQKLPPTVPKVNTKWDGLPSPIKDRAKDLRSSRKDRTLRMAPCTSESASSASEMSFQPSRRSSSGVRFSTPVAQPGINNGCPSVPGIEHQDEEDQRPSFSWSPETHRHQEGTRRSQKDSGSGRRQSNSAAEPLASSGSSCSHGEQHVHVSPDTRKTAIDSENKEEQDPQENASEQEGTGAQYSHASIHKAQDMTAHVAVSSGGWSGNKGRLSVDKVEALPWDEQNLPIPPCLLPPPLKEGKKLVPGLLAGDAAGMSIW
ncbi:hypothetical protein BDV97DRAFT_357818 [Delphinella strobiligena]|nr:hypothetical protein BDV97DRAFT_357818 [Delphinella strobiligena]